MDIENLEQLCMSLPNVTQDIKWGNDLVFSIGAKMFCVVGLNQSPTSASFKVDEEEFDEMAARPFFKPAPYVAKYKWVLLEDISKMPKKEWETRLQKSYELVYQKLLPKIKKQLEQN